MPASKVHYFDMSRSLASLHHSSDAHSSPLDSPSVQASTENYVGNKFSASIYNEALRYICYHCQRRGAVF